MTLNGDRDGHTYSHDEDYLRLNRQAKRVFEAMADGLWHRPRELERLTEDNWSSINARLRDLRKAKFGGWDVQKRRLPSGLFEYRLAGKAAIPPVATHEPVTPLPGQRPLL
jgi:hypothetical protein